VNHYPRHIGDFLKKTIGLTMRQDGAYNRMIDLYYGDEKPLPVNRVDLYGSLRCRDKADNDAVEHCLRKYFTEQPDGFHHDRCDEEIAKYREKSAKASQSASARWGDSHSGRNANASPDAMRTHSDGNAKAMLTNNQEPVTRSTRSTALSGSQANADDSRLLLAFLNLKAKRFFRPTPKTLEPILARLKEGNTVSDCKAVIVRRCRAWKDDPTMAGFLRPQTLFGATKFAQYIGEVPPDEEEHADQDLP
jgi:uncharacterized phage protein (TIGR02220 family)